jgi:hypothetical protein
MHLLLTVDGYFFKYFGDVIFNGLLGVINAWLFTTTEDFIRR